MAREDTARHEKTRQGTRRHGKAREDTTRHEKTWQSTRRHGHGHEGTECFLLRSNGCIVIEDKASIHHVCTSEVMDV